MKMMEEKKPNEVIEKSFSLSLSLPRYWSAFNRLKGDIYRLPISRMCWNAGKHDFMNHDK